MTQELEVYYAPPMSNANVRVKREDGEPGVFVPSERVASFMGDNDAANAQLFASAPQVARAAEQGLKTLRSLRLGASSVAWQRIPRDIRDELELLEGKLQRALATNV